MPSTRTYQTEATLASIELPFVRVMHLLILPDELFLMEIFPSLHSTDLIRAFGTLSNTRLLSLIYAFIRHLDLPGEMNSIETLQHYQWTQIRSLGIHEDHLHEAIGSIFPSLDDLHVRMASSSTPSISSTLLSLSPRVKHLRLLFDQSKRMSIGHLPKLKPLYFCVLRGFGGQEYKNPRSFDSCKHQRPVISICNSWPGSHTRFSMPFVFDRLERVTNDFVDFHFNEARPHTSISHFDLLLCWCPVEPETNDPHSQACLSPIATSAFQNHFPISRRLQ
jgi:hypothetical protein